MRLLGMAAVAVLAIVIGSVALPAFAGQWGENSDEGRALSDATGATMRQASDVGNSFGSLIPASAEAASEGDDDVSVQDSPEPPDAPNNPVQADDDVQHEVAAALAALASVDAGRGDVATDERIAAIENLRDTWSPRYRQAEEEHQRLAYRIEHADRAATRYFSVQTELTGYIKNRDERRRGGSQRPGGNGGVPPVASPGTPDHEPADRIMDDLHDMDIRITKQLLSASFASVYQTSWSCPLPSAICTGTWSSFASGRKRSAQPSSRADPSPHHNSRG